MKLPLYLEAKQLTDEQFGAMIGRDRSNVHRLRTGAAKPTFDVIQRVLEVTGGVVAPNDWFDFSSITNDAAAA